MEQVSRVWFTPRQSSTSHPLTRWGALPILRCVGFQRRDTLI
jgi:hypothetical protein